jgi:thermostable 8-oxoguanine DNA glycosylase
MSASLNLDQDSAFLRGIEYADDAIFDRWIVALAEMRKSVRYSNQDVDRRMTARSILGELRKVGNTPLLTHNEMVVKLAAERNAQFQAAQG